MKPFSIQHLIKFAHKHGFEMGNGISPYKIASDALVKLGMDDGKSRTCKEHCMQFGLYIKEEAIHYHPPKKMTKPQQARVKKAQVALHKQIAYAEGYSKHKSSGAGSSSFLKTMEWKRLRMEALKKYGAKCQCCGVTPAMGAVMNVDHIKPRKFYPELALDINNLQVLCGSCNMGKSNWDMTDWREPVE